MGSFYQDHCIYLPSMLGWFVFSALLSSYNKLVFGEEHLAFPCPLLLTSIHFLVQWLFAYGISSIFPVYFGGTDVKLMDWKTFLGVSIPCGLVTSGDVGLSNLSLVRISITFYTMVKASTPVFVLGWAFIFGIERITLSLIIVVALIASGEFLTVLGEVSFDLVGFLLCVSASILSGARWTLVQLKLNQLDPPLKTTVATMRVLSPSMFASMLVVSALVENPFEQLSEGYFDTPSQALYTCGLGLGGAFLAICMVMFEFHLIMNSNAIVLMIGGVIKEMITILIGVRFFGDRLNPINVGGMTVVFLGVVFYKVSFHLAKLEQEGEECVEEKPLPNNRIDYRPVQTKFSQDERNGTASLFLTQESTLSLGEEQDMSEETSPEEPLVDEESAVIVEGDKEEHSASNGIIWANCRLADK